MPIHSYRRASDLFPEAELEPIELAHMEGQKWGDQSSELALQFACRLARFGFDPIFEIGTFRGRTTYNLARNAPHARIFTLDLGAAPTGEHVENIAGLNYGDYTPGELFLNAPPDIRDRIELIIGDSATIDLEHLHGQMGLVLVDAGHSYEACLRDSSLAMKLVRPGGIILWDDYGDYWPGVKAAVEKLAESMHLSHVRRENYIVYRAAA